MTETRLAALFTTENLKKIFPAEKTDQFFEAMFGDADEGSYDIELTFKDQSYGTLMFDLCLKKRPGKCLACNLTYGLPKVFERHPVIDIKGVVQSISAMVEADPDKCSWQLGSTREVSPEMHAIPLSIAIAS